MNNLLLIIAILSTGIVYGTDVFFALIVKQAVKKSTDHSIADLIGHIHLIADKRMPFIGITSILSTIAFICFNGPGWLPLTALLSLLTHLALYLFIAKPVNAQMSAVASQKVQLPNIRLLQQKWDRIIALRAILLTIAMTALLNICF